MRSRVGSFVLASLLAGAASLFSADDPGPLARNVDALFAEYTRPGSPGCSLAVIRDGGIVYEKGYGLANVEHGVPIDPRRTVFDIGSTSKQFTAASVLLLAHEGKLSLDDDVHKFLPELPDDGVLITIRHLLHHTSGLRDYLQVMSLGGFSYEDYTTEADALTAIARQKALNFPPGSEYSYSNTGYFLLARIIERVSGKTLQEFEQERIFAPLGMSSTRLKSDHRAVIPHLAASYLPHPAGGFGVETSDWEQTGDGGVQSTVVDLAKWDRNFYEPKVGGPWLIEQLQTAGKLNDGETIEYARGLILDEYRGLRRFAHSGSWAGFGAEMVRLPDQKFSVIALCNLGSADPSVLAQRVTDLYLAGELAPGPAAVPSPSPSPARSAGPVAEPARYTGLYWNPAAHLLRRIVARDGKLLYSRGPDGESELAPSGEDRFLMLGVPGTVELSFSAAVLGAPRRMQLFRGGGKPQTFEEVQPASPRPEDLAAYAGTYTSAELDTTWVLTVENGRLSLHPKRGAAIPFEPLFVDTFHGRGGRRLLRFQRDAGKVTGFAVDVSGARDLKFTKASP